MEASNDSGELCPICGHPPVVLDRDLLGDALEKTSKRLNGELLAQCATLHLRGIRSLPGPSEEAAMSNWNTSVRERRINNFMTHLNTADAIRINGGDPIVWFEWSVRNVDAPASLCLLIRTKNDSFALALTEHEIGSGHFTGTGEFLVESRGEAYLFAFFVLKQFGDVQLGLAT